MNDLVCVGCGLLCDDIRLEIRDGRIASVQNACIVGNALIHASDDPSRRTACSVRHAEVSLEEAIAEAKRILTEARRPLIFGLDDSTLQAQAGAVRLARKLGAVIADASSFTYDWLVQGLLEGSIPGCSLNNVKDKADLLIYWGSNPSHSHPRHLSTTSYYAYTEYEEAGWLPRATLSCVEVRATEFSSICNPAFRLPPGGDGDFIQAILSVLEGNEGTEDARTFVKMVKASRNCVIFCGRGLACSLNGNLELFVKLLQKLCQSNSISVIPMIENINMLGFNRLLREETGHTNQVSFAGGIISHGREFSLLEQLRAGHPDCVLIVGSDPFSKLPPMLRKNLSNTKTICLSSLITPTTTAAHVVLATAIPGIEHPGKVIRMDGQEVELLQSRESAYPSEENILERLSE